MCYRITVVRLKWISFWIEWFKRIFDWVEWIDHFEWRPAGRTHFQFEIYAEETKAVRNDFDILHDAFVTKVLSQSSQLLRSTNWKNNYSHPWTPMMIKRFVVWLGIWIVRKGWLRHPRGIQVGSLCLQSRVDWEFPTPRHQCQDPFRCRVWGHLRQCKRGHSCRRRNANVTASYISYVVRKLFESEKFDLFLYLLLPQTCNIYHIISMKGTQWSKQTHLQ